MMWMQTLTIVGLILSFIGEDSWSFTFSQKELLFAFIEFIVKLIVLTVVFYVAGRVVVGKRRARFSDAFVISLFGTLVGTILSLFIPLYWLGEVLSLIVWLLLIRHYYETGWLGALAVGILAVIVMIILGFLVGLLLGLLVAMGLFLL